jgi:predicted nucleic-acid-binding Zn-ribbon protein
MSNKKRVRELENKIIQFYTRMNDNVRSQIKNVKDFADFFDIDENRFHSLEECPKCGFSYKIGEHNKAKCNYSLKEIDCTVEDIDIMYKISNDGYGVWELSIIGNIMKELYEKSTNVVWSRWGYANQNLFREAEKIYKKRKQNEKSI